MIDRGPWALVALVVTGTGSHRLQIATLGDIPQEASSMMSHTSDATNIDEVRCTDEDLRNFHLFISKKEEEQIGCSDGVFKIIIDPANRVGSLPDLLKRLEGSMKEVVRQELRSMSNHIYLFMKRSVHKKDKASFMYEACKASSYDQETCCSSILRNGSLDGLLDHFFEDVLKSQAISVLKVASSQEKMASLLQKGMILRKTFEDIGEGTMFSVLKRKCETTCSCPECETDKEASDEEDANPQTILYAAGITLINNKNEPLFITRTLSLSRLKNILLLSRTHYDGITSPLMYVGKRHSFFPLHIEDMALWSINFHHYGHFKIWFVIPPNALLLLMFHLRHSSIFIGDSTCWNSLGHKTVFPSLKWLRARRIPFKVVVQKPGDAIILYPNAAHFGFSLGFNVGEAINFATVSWLPEGINAPKCQCIGGQVHMDVTQLVAAFRPDLLERYVGRKLILTQSMLTRSAYLHKSLKDYIDLEHATKESGRGKEHENYTCNAEGKSRYGEKNKSCQPVLVKCPVLMCTHEYHLSKRQRMVNHVLKKHKPLVDKCKLIERIDKLFQKIKRSK